jgi:hypothetical protein
MSQCNLLVDFKNTYNAFCLSDLAHIFVKMPTNFPCAGTIRVPNSFTADRENYWQKAGIAQFYF